MKNTAPTAKKSPSLRTLRRQFLADQKPTVLAPLSVDERSKLFDLIEEASASNHYLLDAGRDLDESREALNQAIKRLKEAEDRMVKTRRENSSVHELMAPLLHRLPTV